MSIINKTAVLIPFSDLTAKEYSDRLTAIEAQAASSLATQKSEVAAAIAQVNLTQSQTITALTLEVSNLTNLTDTVTALINSATTTQTELVNRADQLAQDVTDITVQLTQDKATFTQDIQDALDYLKDDASVASALRTPRKINGTDFDGRSDITTNAWGATRTFQIGDKTISINGTSNVNYSLADIGAFPEVGGTIQGNVEITGNLSADGTITATLEGTAARADKLQVARKIQGVDFDGTKDISLPTFTTQTDGLVPKRVGATTTKYLREDGTWVVPPDTTYALLTAANAEAGTATSANTISAQVLKDAIKFHAPPVTDIAGNAGTATKLQTARTIAISGAVTGTATGFDGSANISIDTTGIDGSKVSTGTIPAARIPTLNQSTTGNARSATKLQTPRTINGVLFDGTQNILLPESVAYSMPVATASVLGGIKVGSGLAISNSVLSVGTLNQSTTGNAATATKLATASTINGVSFDGSASITLPLASTAVSGTVQLNNTLTSTSTGQALTTAQGKVLNDTKLAKTENAVSASKLQTSRTISLSGGVTGSVSFDGSANASISTAITGLGVANGIATLDSNGQVPSTQLPSFVDDVLEYLNVAAFPATGESNKIYVETTGNTTYRWGGTGYVKITSGDVSSVAGKTGVVTLSKADVGLANVDNTTDSSKSVASASKLTTARTIAGVSFDGTANISLPGVNTTGNQSTTGNASTATTLQTACTINGTSFNGSADITTTNWGTARTLTLGSTGKSINGSADVSWSADEILPAGVSGQSLKHNGTSWVAGTDNNILYSAMTEAEATSGTATTASLITPAVLKSAITSHAPVQTSITDNAATATKLTTARTINGVNFDGTKDITTIIWGTYRTFTIGRTGKPVNGSGNVNWTADEILPTGTAGQVLKHDGTSWVSSTNSNTTYTAMTATTANAGTDTTAQVISPRVLKQAIQTHAPVAAGGGGGGMNFAAKVEIELETVFDLGSGDYRTSGNIISVSNQTNIASAVMDSNGILCLTFNTPISNPHLIATTKNEVKTVTREGVNYAYLTSAQNGNFKYTMSNYMTYGIFQYVEKGYVNTNTKLYISCNLKVSSTNGGISTIRSTFPAIFNLGIIDA